MVKCTACTECQKIKKGCVFANPDDAACIRCTELKLVCYKKTSHQGARPSPTTTSYTASENKKKKKKKKKKKNQEPEDQDGLVGTSPKSSKPQKNPSQSELSNLSSPSASSQNVDGVEVPPYEGRPPSHHTLNESKSTKEKEPDRHWDEQTPADVSISDLCLIDTSGRFSARGNSFVVCNDPDDVASEDENVELPVHHGIDLQEYAIPRSGYGPSSFSSTSNRAADSTGIRYVFEVCEGSSNFVAHKINKRVEPQENPKNCAFIVSTQFRPRPLSRDCRGCLLAFTLDGILWEFGVISRLRHRAQEFENPEMNVYAGCFQVYKWMGQVTYDEGNCATPYFFLAETQEERLNDLKLVTISFRSNEPKMKFCFLNQICGTPPDTGKIFDDVVNDIDGCFQCSKYGPDRFPKTLDLDPTPMPWLVKAKAVPVTEQDTGYPSAFVSLKRVRSPLKNDDASTKWKNWHLCRNPDAMISACVVTTDTNSPIRPIDLSKILPESKNWYYVPDPDDMLNALTQQMIYIFDEKQYTVLKKCKGVPLRQATQFLRDNCTHKMEMGCANFNEFLRRDERYNGFSQIFAGPVTPDYSNFARWYPEDGVASISHIGLLQPKETTSFDALSTTCYDERFHPFLVTRHQVRQMYFAYGNRGSYPSRPSTKNHGHSTFLGKRADGTMTRNTPSCGPGDDTAWHFYRQTYNDHHIPPAMHLVNSLTHSTYWNAVKTLNFSSFMKGDKQTMLGMTNLSILTVNFDTNIHVDKNDRWQRDDAEQFIDDLLEVIDTVEPGTVAHTDASNHLQFVSEFGVSVPTTCCYQFPSDNPDITVLQAFVFPHLRMCLRIRHLMTHQFYAGLVQHATCVPVFYDISDDVVNDISFCSHPDVDVMAWGSGSDPKKKKSKNGKRKAAKPSVASPTTQSPATSPPPRVLHSVSEMDPQLLVQNPRPEKLFDSVYESPSKKDRETNNKGKNESCTTEANNFSESRKDSPRLPRAAQKKSSYKV